MPHTLAEIATALGAAVHGDGTIVISGAAEPAAAGAADLAMAMTPDYAEDLGRGSARAAVLWDGADWRALGLAGALVVTRPRMAMAGITRLLDPGPDFAPGVHAQAIVDPSARIGDGAAIGPFSIIAADAIIGARARIGAHVSIGRGARIGCDATLFDGVRIGARVRLGCRVMVHPNAVLGADGFSFVTPEKSGVETVRETLGSRGDAPAQVWTRIHSLGGVEIGDDVEIGACATVDAGTIRPTRVGRGTKIDNLVTVGHNVEVGCDVLLCGQVGIAGSARIGDRVVLGGQCGVSDNIFVGNDVVAGGGSKIYTNVPAGRVVLGSPATRMDIHLEAMKNLRRLPRLFRAVAELQKAVPKAGGSD